jgi:hypothetical protein
VSTVRAQIKAIAIAALDGVGKPSGLTVHLATKRPTAEAQLPTSVVLFASEKTKRATPSKTSPLVERRLRVELHHYAAGDNAQDGLEAQLAWGTRIMTQNPTWDKLAIETDEIQTDWVLESLEQDLGQAIQAFEIRYSTKTSDQETKQ